MRFPASRGHRLAGLGILDVALFAAVLTVAVAGPDRASAQDTAPNYVIMDNDFAGPGATDMQAVLPLLADPSAKVLGLTVVTGDGWENAESARNGSMGCAASPTAVMRPSDQRTRPSRYRAIRSRLKSCWHRAWAISARKVVEDRNAVPQYALR